MILIMKIALIHDIVFQILEVNVIPRYSLTPAAAPSRSFS